jgi:enoyl-CoA hydratase/carnithine racemase
MTNSTPATTAAEAFEAGEVLYEEAGQIATLTFNRPKVRNALTFGMYEALYEGCERFDNNEALRVLVLKGAGEAAFVAGTDISQFRTFDKPEDALAYEARMDRVIGRLDRVKKPVIAMLRGYTVGGGAAIAMGADLRLANPALQFGVPVARTLGNCLSIRNYARLLDLIGPARAKEIMFTARMVGAEEALAAGLINEIVPDDQLEPRTLELAQTIAANAPLTIRATKEAINRLQAHRRLEEADDLILMCYMSEDFKEGVDAFLNKRKPIWKGK